MRHLFVALLFLAACGEDRRIEVKVPSAAEVRAHFGLVSGNCYRYRISGAVQTFATFSVSGPDSVSLAGKSLYVRSYRSESGHKQTREMFEVAAPSLTLRRSIVGAGTNAVTKTFDSDPAPLFGTLEYDEADAVRFKGTSFNTTATPMGGMAEDHQWTVFPGEEDVVVHDGTTKKAIKLSYRLGGKTALYSLVPGYGIGKFTDTDGESHQVCAACVASADGGCTEAQCAALACTP